MLIDVEGIIANEKVFHILDILWRDSGADANQTLICVHFSHGKVAYLNVQSATWSIHPPGENTLVLDQLNPD